MVVMMLLIVLHVMVMLILLNAMVAILYPFIVTVINAYNVMIMIYVEIVLRNGTT